MTRLIDAEALRDALEQADLDVRGEWDHMQWERVLDAAPTVACERCEHFATDQTVTDAHICLWYESSVLAPTPDFGCVYFQPSDAGGE